MNRRQFLAGAGASLLAAPFVSLLGARPARGEPPRIADRLVLFFSPNGTVHEFWRPQGAGRNFSFPKGSILEPLAPHAADLVVCDGVDFVGIEGHPGGMCAMLTGSGGANDVGRGGSVDQYVASQIGGNSRFASLELGVQTSFGAFVARQTRMAFSGLGVPVTPEDNPQEAWKRLFSDVGQAGGGLARIAARRKSILDAAGGDLAALRARVGAGDRARLDQHLDSLRQLERSLATSAAACQAPPVPPALAPRANDSFPAIVRIQTDLLVAALACGMTRVASLQCASSAAQQVLGWEPVDAVESHHDLSHKDPADTEGIAAFVRCERWFCQQFVYLIERLKATPDAVRGGSLFDSSLVVWAKELGDGRLHTCFSVPFVLTGGANGFLRRGEYLVADHAPHQRLLTTLCHGMGLKNDSFGSPQYGTGPLDGVAA